MSDKIVKAAIYPALGIARVGNAPGAQDYFLGPEKPGPHPRDENDFRDSKLRIKRQAQRFRVYGLNAIGEVVRELTSDDADISWKVEIANKKAAWYQFSQALDIPASKGEIKGVKPTVNPLRNQRYGQREDLAITPGPVQISGARTNHDGSDCAYAFDDGEFMGTRVYLGELRTDNKGRLIFLGGRGHTAPAKGFEDAPLPGFGNNPWWHDDTSDGPILADVVYRGKPLEVDYAWVLTAPPNYAPGIPANVTGYELLYDVGSQMDKSMIPHKPNFYEHIYPVLEHFAAQEWVNAGFARDFGWGSPQDFRDPKVLRRLSDPGESSRALRTSIVNRFRDPHAEFMQANAWPPYYGDAMTLEVSSTDPMEWMAIPPLHYQWLQDWANGNFDNQRPAKDDSPAAEAEGLTFAALNETLGGPFHPGCEFTWPMRHTSMYYAPFRVKYRKNSKLDYGAKMNSKKVMKKNGPLDGNGPGDITRWMACPWQTDTSSCLSSYQQYSGEYLPTFWPARVPNDVMTNEQFKTLTNPKSSERKRAEAFNPLNRPKWLRGIDYTNDIPAKNIHAPNPRKVFTYTWWQVAILVPKETGLKDPAYPKQVWVETGRSFDRKRHDKAKVTGPRPKWADNPKAYR